MNVRDARRHHDPLARPEGVHGGSQSAARGPLEDVERLRPSPMYVRRAPRCCTLGTVDLGHPAAAPVSWAAFTTTSRVLVIGSVVSKPWLIIPCSPEREEMRRVLDDTGVHLRGEAAPAATPGWVGRPLAPATKRADPAALRCGLGRVNLHRAAHHVDAAHGP